MVPAAMDVVEVAGVAAGAALLDGISTRAPLRRSFRWGTSTTLAKTSWCARYGGLLTVVHYFLLKREKLYFLKDGWSRER